MTTSRLCIATLTTLLSLGALSSACGDDDSSDAATDASVDVAEDTEQDAEEDAEPPPPLDPTYENVEALLLRACARQGCHGGTSSAANLGFQDAIDEGTSLAAVLVDQDSCQYPRMKLVAPGDPDNSWMLIKSDPASADDNRTIEFEPASDWDTSMRDIACTPPVGDFGQLMPLLVGADLPAREVTLLREWIEAGAPME